MSNTIQGGGSPLVAPELQQEASRVAQLMGVPTAAPRIAADAYATGGSQRGSVPGAAPILDPAPSAQSGTVQTGTAPAAPEVFVDDRTGQLVNQDGSAYLGRNLFLAQDQSGQEVVVDEHDQIVNLAQLEAQAAPAQGASGAASAQGAAPPAGQAQPPAELLIGQDGRLLGPDQQPYLGQELYVAQDEFGNQVVVDAQNTIVNLEDLEARHARGELPAAQPAAPAAGAPAATGAPATSTAPPPPQFFLGQNNQIVDRTGQPYLGQTMFVQQDAQGQPQVVDGSGQVIDLDALIARAGFNPQAEPVDNPNAPAQPQGTQPQGAPAQGPAPAANGSVNPGGYARNAGAVLADLWRSRGTPAAAPPAPTPPGGDDGAVQARAPRRVRPDATTRVSRRGLTPRGRTTATPPAEPATAASGTSRGTLVRGPDGRFRRLGPNLEPLPAPTRRARGTASRQTPANEPPAAGARQQPVRDSRGRFVSQPPATATPPAAGSRQVPLRDANGRFVARQNTEAHVVMRNNRGRFVKPHPSVSASINPPHGQPPASAPAAAGPVRDSRGRFVARQTATGTPPAAGNRQVPVRGPDGRFLPRTQTTAPAATPSAAPPAGVRRLPVRGPNGQFVSAAAAPTPAPATAASRRVRTTPAATTATPAATRLTPVRGPNGRFVSGSSAPGGARTASTAAQPPSSSRISLSGRILPAALLVNDAYNLYQGVNHWNDQGNNSHIDDALRVGGSAVSAVASANTLRSGNIRSGVAMHVTGLAMNTLGTILNDQ